MKCLKVQDYFRRTTSPDETRVLREELENYVKNGPGLEGRTLCDRVIRACNQQLGAGTLDTEHLENLMGLVDVALHGYESISAPVLQSDHFYMVKILFHILKKAASIGSHKWCEVLANLLYDRLVNAPTTEDCELLARTCFTVLWGELAASGGGGSLLSPTCRISRQFQALRFLLLQGGDPQGHPKVIMYAMDAMSKYVKSCGVLKEDSAHHLLEQIRHHLLGPLQQGGCQGGPVLCDLVLCLSKHLCKASQWDLALELLAHDTDWLRGSPCSRMALNLARGAIYIHRAPAEHETTLTECARTLGPLSTPPVLHLQQQERHTLLLACQMVTWVLELSQPTALRGRTLLAWLSFLEEYQQLLQKHIQESAELQMEQRNYLQQTLCYSLQQCFNNAYDSLSASQLEDRETMDKVLLHCRTMAAKLLREQRKLQADRSVFTKAVSAVSTLVCGLYNHKLYEEAFSLGEILCREIQKNRHPSLPVEKLNRAFMLVVQSSRRAGQLDRALDWVVHWLRALGGHLLGHMTEPVSLWAKTKVDAARGGQEDTRLRTLRDGFGQEAPSDEMMIHLLEEELRAYREVAGDTAQERYNTLCDLLDLCPEGGPCTLSRALYLCEMAQVICFQDFSEQTDGSAVDFVQEALRLMEDEKETEANSARLKDQKAQALLWVYICNLEKNLQQAIEREQRLAEAQDRAAASLEPLGTNDLDYEDKQKRQDCQQVYESLRFNLSAENKQIQSLDGALEQWKALLAGLVAGATVPAVRSTKQTISSLKLMGALYKLMGKPLQALESYQLAVGLSQAVGDSQSCAASLCQAVQLLLELGAPERAQVQLEQAEQLLQPRAQSKTAEGPTPLDTLAVLLRAQLCYHTGQVEVGASLLFQVLKEVGDHRQSKSWYLLRAKAVQTASAYLTLDMSVLPHNLRQSIAQHGLKDADSALYEGLKLLCSLLVTVVGNGFYGASSAGTDTRFVDQGENLQLKWQLLWEVLSCSQKVVVVRSHCGAVHEARAQCLEALKLATKLQTLSLCAELLVVKAELELQRGEEEQSEMDLEQVKGLLDLCTDFTSKEEKVEVKLKPRKGCPAKKGVLASSAEEEDYSGFLSTRPFPRAAVQSATEWAQSASPPLKAKVQSVLVALGHPRHCACLCCSDPMLARVAVRWAAVRADLTCRAQQGGSERRGHRFFLVALSRSEAATASLAARLGKLQPGGKEKDPAPPSFLRDLTARVYLRMVLCSLRLQSHKPTAIWEFLEAGLEFVRKQRCPELAPVHAGLQTAKALVSILTLASKLGCRPDELFSPLWAWTPSAKPRDTTKPLHLEKKTKELEPHSTQQTTKDKNSEIPSHETKKANGRPTSSTVPKIRVTFPSIKTKAARATTAAKALKANSTPQDEASVFDFGDDVPQIAVRSHSPGTTHTPVGKGRLAAPSRRTAAKPGSKLQFQVYDESSPTQVKPRQVPAAPKRSKRSRFKVEFSDESDIETSTPAPARTAAAPKPNPEPSSPRAGPKRNGRAKRGAALPLQPVPRPSVEEKAPPQQSLRRGRSKKPSQLTGPQATDEPETMRSVEEDEEEELQMETSIEHLRTSDTEEAAPGAPRSDPDREFEVLRREPLDLEHLSQGSHFSILPHPPVYPSDGPGCSSQEEVRSLLRSALLPLLHFPPPGLCTQLCGLLALSIGHSDPLTTSMLHAQSLGLASRHHMARHLAARLGKLKKAAASDLAAKLSSLSLDDPSRSGGLQQRLARLESIFSFSSLDAAGFPHQHAQHFSQQLQNIPPGVTVCLLSVVSEQLGEVGNTILLSRLQCGAPPITVRIPTAQHQCPVSISAVLQEMDSVQKQQKVVSSVADKAEWWEGRKDLDHRMEMMLEEMAEILGVWQALLLPLSSDPRLSLQAKALLKSLTEEGAQVTEEMLKAVLSASPLLSPQHLSSLASGLCPGAAKSSLATLQEAVLALKDCAEPRGHVILVLDKYLQKLPWENISCLRPHTVTRMPSLHFLLGHCALRELDPESVLNQGVNPQEVFYVLNPDANLKDTEERFREWFTSESAWQGVCGAAPSPDQIQQAVTTKDLYIYVGHGAGARFLNSQKLLKQELHAAALLFGCSSAALAIHGELEGTGVILNYLMAGCPLVLGNLWDVTDRDIDRFTKALLQSWFSAGCGAGLLDHMASSRQATYLKHLIGAAPVVYGLPVSLK